MTGRKGRTPERDADFANRFAAKLRAQPNMGVFVITIPGDPNVPASISAYGADEPDTDAVLKALWKYRAENWRKRSTDV